LRAVATSHAREASAQGERARQEAAFAAMSRDRKAGNDASDDRRRVGWGFGQ
jgi:hypothetical protein